MVDLAISSLALAIFSRTQHHPPAAREAALRYGRLLHVVQEQFNQSGIWACNVQGIDERLLTIVLMAWYETAMHQPAHARLNEPFRSLHSWSHYDGAMAILKTWNDSLSHTAPSSIIKQARRGLVRSALLRDLPLPDWIMDGSRFGENGLDLGFDSVLFRVVNFRHASKSQEQQTSFLAADFEVLSQQGRKLNQACQDWASQIPSAWHCQSHGDVDLKFWPNRDFYTPTVHTYAHPGYAAVWIQYFATQMLIDSTRLSLLQMSRSQYIDTTYEEESDECKSQLRRMAESLASTIPFSLNRFRSEGLDSLSSKPTITLNTDEDIRPALALFTVWPLSMASSLGGVEPGQKLWFSAQLARLGRVLGDGALLCAGTDQWAHS
jgi:hypothetical protein